MKTIQTDPGPQDANVFALRENNEWLDLFRPPVHINVYSGSV